MRTHGERATLAVDAPLGIAVIGAGLIGQAVHIPTLRRMPEFRLLSVADPSAKVCRELAGRYPGIQTHTDWRALLENDRLDAVVICSPNATHAEIALAALEADLHVLVEKPLAITIDDVESIIRLAAKKELVVQVGYMKRFDAAYERLLESLPATAQGLRLIDVVTFDPWMARPPFVPADLVVADDVTDTQKAQLAQRERSQVEDAVGPVDPRAAWIYSNVFLGALIHDVNLVHGLAERLGLSIPARAITAAYWADGKAAHTVFDFGHAVRWQCAWLLLDRVGIFRETATLYFEDCVHTLRFGAPYFRNRPTVLESITRSEPGVDQRFRHRRVKDPYLAELEHFHTCIVEGARCRAPAEQARADLFALQHAFVVASASHSTSTPT